MVKRLLERSSVAVVAEWRIVLVVEVELALGNAAFVAYNHQTSTVVSSFAASLLSFL